MGMARNIAGKVGGRRGGSPGCPPGGGAPPPEGGGRGGLAELFRRGREQQQQGPVGNPGGPSPPLIGPAVPGGYGGMNTQGRGGFMDGMQPNRPQMLTQDGMGGRMQQQQALAQQMRAVPNPGGGRAALGNPRQQRVMRGGPTSYGGGRGGRRY